MEVKDSDKPKTCIFCNQSEDNELQYGKFYELDGDIVTHYYCLLLSSNMEQNGGDNDGILGFLREDILKELRRGKRLTCSYCRSTGATLGCCVSRCKKVFHLPCGRRAGSLHQFFGQFKSFCASHRPLQKIDANILQQSRKKEATCPICYDDVDPMASKTTLWAPCCRVNAWFHRDCVQKLAMSAGYFFKCPLCNNKATFQKAMLDFGIYIPEQDASWELVPNAYQELLHRHKRCDATRCHCPKGRIHEMTGTRWELVLCKFCGSQGVHIGCGQLKWSNPEWECDECKVMLQQAREHPASDCEDEQQEETPTVSGTAVETRPAIPRRNRRIGRRRFGRRQRNVIENSTAAAVVEESSSSRTSSPITGPVSPPTPIAVVELSDDDDVVEILDDNSIANITNKNGNNGPVVLTSDGRAIPVVQVPSIPLIPEGEDFCVVGDLNVKMPVPQQTTSTTLQPSRTLVSNLNPPTPRSAVKNNNNNNVPRSQTTSINSFVPLTQLCDEKPKPAGLLKVTYSNTPLDGDQPVKRIRVSDPIPVSNAMSGNMLKTYLSDASQNLQPKQQQQKNQQPQSVKQSGLMAVNQQKQTEMVMMNKQQQSISQSRIITNKNQQTGMMVMQQQQDVNQSGMIMMSQQQQMVNQSGMVMMPSQSNPQTSVLRGQTLAQPTLMMMMPQQQLAQPVRGQSVMNQPTMMMVQQPPAMCVSSHPNSRWSSPSSSSAAVHGGICSSATVPGSALCSVKLCTDSATTTSPAATHSQQCHRSHGDRENCHEQRDDGRRSDNRVIPSNLSLSDLRFKLINSNTLQMVLCDNFAIRFGIVTSHYKNSGSNHSSQNTPPLDKDIVAPQSGGSNKRSPKRKHRVPMEYRVYKRKRRNFFYRNKTPSSSRQRERSPSISRSYTSTLSRGRSRTSKGHGHLQSKLENINSLTSLNGHKCLSHSKQINKFVSPVRNEVSCSRKEHNSECRTGISESRAAMSISLSSSGSSKSRSTNHIPELRNTRYRGDYQLKHTRSRSVSPSEHRKSRSVSPSEHRRSKNVSPSEHRRSKSMSQSRNTRSRSLSPSEHRRSRSVSPSEHRRSRSVSPSEHRRSKSVSQSRSRNVSQSRSTRSRSLSPLEHRRSRNVSPSEHRRSRSVSPSEHRRSKSIFQSKNTKSRNVSQSRSTRSRSLSPSEHRRSRGLSPSEHRRSRSVSPSEHRRSRSVSQSKSTRSRSVSPSEHRRSRSVSQSKSTRSRSVSPSEHRRSRSVSQSKSTRSRSLSPSEHRRSRSVSQSKSTRSRSVSPAEHRRSKNVSQSRNTRSRSVLQSRDTRSRSVSPAEHRRSKSVCQSRSTRSRSVSQSRSTRSRSVSPAEHRRSKSVSQSRNTGSRSVLQSRNTRSRSVSQSRSTRSRSMSPAEHRRSKSVSQSRNTRSRSVSQSRSTRSRSVLQSRSTRSRSVSPAEHRRSKSVSQSRNTRSRSVSQLKRTRSGSVSQSRSTRSRSVSPAEHRRSKSVSQSRNTRSRSVSQLKRTRSGSVSQSRNTRSRSVSQLKRTRSGSVPQLRNTRSTSMSHLRNVSSRSVSLSRCRRSRSMPLSRNRRKMLKNESMHLPQITRVSTASVSRSTSRLSNPDAVSVSVSRNKRVETSRNKRPRSSSTSRNKRLRSSSAPRISSGNTRKENKKKRNRIDSERSSKDDKLEKSEEFHTPSSKRARKKSGSWMFDTVDISLHTMVLTRSRRERRLRSLKGRKRAFSNIITNPKPAVEMLFQRNKRNRSMSGDLRNVSGSNQKISNTRPAKNVNQSSEKLQVQNDRTSVSIDVSGAVSGTTLDISKTTDTSRSSNRQRSKSESSTMYVRSVVTRSQSKPVLRSKRVMNRSPSFEYPQLTPHSRILNNTKNRQTRKSLPQAHSPRSRKTVVEKENQKESLTKQTRLESLRLQTSLKSQKSVIENEVQNKTFSEQTSVEVVRSQMSILKTEASTSHKFGERVRSKSESKSFDCSSQQFCSKLNAVSEQLKFQNGVRMMPSNSTLLKGKIGENVQNLRTRRYSWSSETGIGSFEEISLSQKNNTVQYDTNTGIGLNRTIEINSSIKDKEEPSDVATNNTVKSHEGSSFCVDVKRFLNDLKERQTEDYIVRMKAKALAARKFRPTSRTEDLQRKMMKELQSLYKSEKS